MAKKTAKKTDEVKNVLEDSDDSQSPELSEDVENPSMETQGDFEVGDPQELRPVELPLVVKPKKAWANEAQEEYARTLNAYAYRNPQKWKQKKDELMRRLAELGKNPEAIVKYRGQDTKVNYNNQIING